ncbi:SAM-dependent methyltransferase, partial [Lutimaribacter sp. EGI FJ00014]|nr:SAM-dependent methyltransferase [Lutimaribacter sp. EGI FJ00014]
DGPLFLVGNELFDALPVRQYVNTTAGWRERVVGLGEDGALIFMAGAGAPDPTSLPSGADAAPEGAVFEAAPAREALMETIAGRLAAQGGAGLFIDYGYEGPALGDTLQAVRRHAYDDVLAHPGEADLTAHVDFAALARIAGAQGLGARLMPQGEFLLGLGLLDRAGRLGAGKSAEEQERIRGEVERLAGPEGMGTLFKVLAVPREVAVPPFDAVS